MSDQERLIRASFPLLSWYRENRRDLPWRKDRDAYRIWISEIMLQQTRVDAATSYYLRFLEHFPTVGALAAAPEVEVLKCWEGLGYYSRARNLKKAAEIVADRYGGVLPRTWEELRALPGIGDYTAGAIASIAGDEPVPAVDGNVLRVISRVLGSREDIAKPAAKRKLGDLLTEVLRELKGRGESPGDFNQALMETGALVCLPNGGPLCAGCPFGAYCIAREKGLTGEIPVKTSPKKRKTGEITVLLLEYGDKIAIRKRKQDGLLASLYEFPNLAGKRTWEEIAKLFGPDAAVEKLPDARHIFSHVEWEMCGYLVRLSDISGLPEEAADGVFFVEWERAREKYPIPSAFLVYKNELERRCTEKNVEK